jgi:sugar O-acyltransferase (sialic acid O-acetyltransferase NeuD family)
MVSRLTPLGIVGAGGFGREVAWLAEEINKEKPTFDLVGFIDDVALSTPEGFPVLGNIDDWVSSGRTDVHLVCALGDSVARWRVATRLSQAGFQFATLVHPTVKRSRYVRIGPGGMICADNVLTTNIEIGAHALLNLDCTVGHDSRLADYVSLMPGVHLSGDVTTDIGAYFGTGAVVINGVRVGAWSVIGAGAVVSSDIPRASIAVGVPAKPIKPNPRAPEEDLA